MDFFQNLLNSVRSGVAKPNTQGMKFADLFVKRNVPESAMILDEEYENPTLTGGALSAYRSGKLDLPQAMRIEAGPNGYSQLLASIPQIMGAQAPFSSEPVLNSEIKQVKQDVSPEKITGSRLYTNSDKTHFWTKAPQSEGLPQRAIDYYSNYNFAGNKKFKNPMSPEYAQLLWNEINEQAPNASYGDKIAAFETMLAVAHAESHSGHNAGGLDRNSNLFNMGFNASPNSVMKYDPEDPAEMADYAVNQFLNTFKIIENKGLTDQLIHNYHIGPNAPHNQAGVDKYRSYMKGWESLYKPTYPWGE